MQHIEHIKVFTLDTPPVSEHEPCDLSNRCFAALIVNDFSGTPDTPIPEGYVKSDVGTTDYTVWFDLSDDRFYINKNHHVALRGGHSNTGASDAVFILCEKAAVAKKAADASKEAAHGRFVLHLPDGAKEYIEPSHIEAGLNLFHHGAV